MLKKPLKPLDQRVPKKSMMSQILVYRRLILFLVVIIVIIVAGYLYTSHGDGKINIPSLNSSNQTIPNGSTYNHYDDGKISFDYPLDWNQSKEKAQPPLMVTVLKDENNSVSIYSEDLGSRPFAEYVVGWRDNLKKYSNVTFEQVTQVDNATAYDVQASSRNINGTYITRDLIFEKNKRVYFIVFVFNKSLLDFKDQMNLMITSFKVKK